jgi:hypothetical protein
MPCAGTVRVPTNPRRKGPARAVLTARTRTRTRPDTIPFGAGPALAGIKLRRTENLSLKGMIEIGIARAGVVERISTFV